MKNEDYLPFPHWAFRNISKHDSQLFYLLCHSQDDNLEPLQTQYKITAIQNHHYKDDNYRSINTSSNYYYIFYSYSSQTRYMFVTVNDKE